jgi:hypothetical protein
MKNLFFCTAGNRIGYEHERATRHMSVILSFRRSRSESDGVVDEPAVVRTDQKIRFLRPSFALEGRMTKLRCRKKSGRG